jgi:hypothetical protein
MSQRKFEEALKEIEASLKVTGAPANMKADAERMKGQLQQILKQQKAAKDAPKK